MLNNLCSSPEMVSSKKPTHDFFCSVFGGGKPWGIYGVFDLLDSTDFFSKMLSDIGVLSSGDSTPYTPHFNRVTYYGLW